MTSGGSRESSGRMGGDRGDNGGRFIAAVGERRLSRMSLWSVDGIELASRGWKRLEGDSEGRQAAVVAVWYWMGQ